MKRPLVVCNILKIFHILYYSLCQLTQLDKLEVRENPLNTVPEVVSSLTPLKELCMKDCRLRTLPERFVCHVFLLFEPFDDSHLDILVQL